MNGCEEIPTKDELVGHVSGLSLKFMVVTTEPAQTEEFGEGNGELGLGRVGGGEVDVGMCVGRFLVDGGGENVVV